MALGLSLRGARPTSWPGETDRVIRELKRLDPWSFWLARVREGDAGDVAVVGTTGAFLISICGQAGYLVEERGRVTIDGRPLGGLREIRKGARDAEHRLAAAVIFTDVEPVVCLTQAAAGLSRTVKGVRVVRLDDLVGELVNRALTLRTDRAAKGAAVLGDLVRAAQSARPEIEDE